MFYGQTIDGIPDRGYKLFITALVMVLIAAIFVAIRLATRIHLRQFGWDDLFLVIALVASVMTTIAINLGKLKDCPDLNNSQHELTFAFQPWSMAMANIKRTWEIVYIQPLWYVGDDN